MERNVNYTIVGLFVAFVLLSFTIFTVWLAGTYDAREYTRYTVLFDTAVGGLEEGGIVKYRGVSVGRVIRIRLVENRPDLVKVDIEVDDATPVRSSTKGALKPQGITGLSFIELKTEGTDNAPLKKQDGELYPMIKAEPSQLDQFFEDAPELSSRLISLTSNLNNVVTKLDTLLDEENMAHISGTLENMNKTTANLNNFLSDENAVSTQNIIKNLEATSKNLNTIVATVSKNQDSLDRFSGEGLDELTLLIRDSRSMANSIKELSDTLKEEPSRIIFQPNYDGVKIKQ